MEDQVVKIPIKPEADLIRPYKDKMTEFVTKEFLGSLESKKKLYEALFYLINKHLNSTTKFVFFQKGGNAYNQ